MTKVRIINRGGYYPYHVEVRKWLRWKPLNYSGSTSFISLADAEQFVKDTARYVVNPTTERAYEF